MKRTIIWTLTTLLALTAAGCGGGAGSSGTTQTSVTPEAAPSTRTARLTLSAAFAEPGQAAKAMIDPRVLAIDVEYYCYDSSYSSTDYGTLSLTPDEPSASLDLVPAKCEFTAFGYDNADPNADRRLIDSASSYGTLVVGANRVVLTFLAGSWTFVNAQGQAAPLELSAAAGSLLLDGFELRPMGYGHYMGPVAAKASEGPGGYVFSWGSRAAATPTVPFSDLSRLSGAYHGAGFSGMTNTSMFTGGFYNLTEGCGDFDPFANYYMEGNSLCSEGAGSRFIAIMANEDGMYEGEGYDPLLPEDTETVNGQPVDFSGYENSTVAAANRITGTLAEVNILTSTVAIVRPGAQAAKASAVGLTNRVGALQAALSGAGKAAQSSNTPVTGLTTTWSQHAIVCEDLNQDGTIDLGDWQLNDYEAVDVDGDGEPDAWEYGWLSSLGNPGECSTGLTLAQGGNPGEWVDDNSNGVIDAWELYDRSPQDGTIDTGDIQLTHYLLYTEVLDAWLYPFAANGNPGTQGTFTVNGYVQYRTFPDPANDRYQAWADVKLSGGPIFESDIVDGNITGPGGTLTVLDENVSFYSAQYLYATWDAANGRFGTLNKGFDTGMSVNLSNYAKDDLAAGDYTISLVTALGDTIATTVNLPSTTALPVVDSNTMDAVWNIDGSLTFSWTAPSGSFDGYRLVMTTWDGYQVMNLPFFYGTVPANLTTITIPATQITEFEAALPTMMEPPSWRLETRNYTGTHNYARGLSGSVLLPDQSAQ